MPNRIKSILLVALQFLFIILLLSGTQLKNISLLAYAFLILSIVLVLWAMATMQKSKLRILPEPSPNATLITNGPYHFIRHPMYTAILLGSVGLLINHFTWMRLSMVIALAIVLIIKLTWEEKMLSKKFGEYMDYMKHTKRILPFIF
jgi:protein-S-isoprenylcysteine O-methyltransferase Ste14